MPRPEKPIAPDAPFEAFALRLRALRRGAGNPTYRAMAARVGHAFSVSTLAGAASGDTMPNLNLTLAYAEACRGDRQYWTEQWFIARGADRLWPGEPWAATPPDPAQASDAAAYIALLRELRLWAGSPSLHRLSRLTGHARSSLGDACAPHRTTVPSDALVVALVRGCLLHAYRNRPWLRKHVDGSPDGWITVTEAAWLRTRHRLKVREAARPRPTVRRHRVAAPDLPAPRPVQDLLPAVRLPEPTPVDRTAETPGPAPDEAARPSRLRPLPADLPSEVLALATSLRRVFGLLEISTRRFAARHHYDASSVSRYLAGSRLPPVEFVHTLVREAEASGHSVEPDLLPYLLGMHTDALRVVNPQAHELAFVRGRLRAAVAREALLEERARALEDHIRKIEARSEALRREDPWEAA
ncbi:hypothetical protein PV721_21680 [Streptomyces sp. MB09-01]|uniref:hypothetical protein n=1 Tax=Streptomyces sp. MB09-01 TaxID=3028666 RepID=UPI0029B14CC7|nr:hypothetical protein [Streptomyces sp. MB09-01]MDX3536938.1 hypothetical protein [Streptomyces sp. MB09-01]